MLAKVASGNKITRDREGCAKLGVREINNSSSLENDKKQFKESLEAELACCDGRSVIDLTEREAARELLVRLYLIGCQFESIGGQLSRVAWMEMPEPSKRDSWQEAAKHRNDSMHGEPERMPEVHVSKLYESEEYDFVKGLMVRTGMHIDTRMMNRDKALAKREDGMNELHHCDLFLDRAHSTGLANDLIVKDILTKRAMKQVVEMQRCCDDASRKLQEWCNADVARSGVAKLLSVVSRHRQRKQLENAELTAKTNLECAEKAYAEAQQDLGQALDVAYSQEVQGKHYHLQFGVAQRKRREEFYQKFFDRIWPYDAWVTSSADSQQTNNVDGKLSVRQAEIERIIKLRVCLGLEV